MVIGVILQSKVPAEGNQLKNFKNYRSRNCNMILPAANRGHIGIWIGKHLFFVLPVPVSSRQFCFGRSKTKGRTQIQTWHHYYGGRSPAFRSVHLAIATQPQPFRPPEARHRPAPTSPSD